jgi:hypothetical protein
MEADDGVGGEHNGGMMNPHIRNAFVSAATAESKPSPLLTDLVWWLSGVLESVLWVTRGARPGMSRRGEVRASE